MQATQIQIQIEQANSQSFIRDLYTAAQQILLDTDGQDDKALSVVELVEDGKYLEAVTVGMNF